MPTFRQDVRLGTKVPLMKTEDYSDKSVTTEKLADNVIIGSKLPNGVVDATKIADNNVLTRHIADSAVTTPKIANLSITIEKVAEEVWNKIKSEYLRLDGTTKMQADLNLANNSIQNIESVVVNELKGRDTLCGAIQFSDRKKILLGCYDTDGSEDPTFYHPVTIDDGDLYVSYGSVTVGNTVAAKGYNTTDQSHFGLLGNESSVILAMTDSDVDAVLSSVFN